MKKPTLILAACAAALTATLRADDMTVTLQVPVPVEQTTTIVVPTTTPAIEQIIINPPAREIGIKIHGVDARIVVSEEAYDAVMAPNQATLLTAIQAALTAALTATPAP